MENLQLNAYNIYNAAKDHQNLTFFMKLKRLNNFFHTIVLWNLRSKLKAPRITIATIRHMIEFWKWIDQTQRALQKRIWLRLIDRVAPGPGTNLPRHCSWISTTLDCVATWCWASQSISIVLDCLGWAYNSGMVATHILLRRIYPKIKYFCDGISFYHFQLQLLTCRKK